MTTISVVTPAYNAAKTVQESIDSVQAQTVADWEMLIVDDGSNDGTWEILEAAAARDPRIRPIRANHGGASAARNRGIENARGAYIAFLDADDLAVPERFAKQIAFLESHPDIDVVGGLMQRILPDGSSTTLHLAGDPEELERTMWIRNPLLTSTVMARRRFFNSVGVFDTNVHRVEDYDLWLRGHRTMRYANLPEVLVTYRASVMPRWRDNWLSAKLVWRHARREGVLLRHGLWAGLRRILGFLKYLLFR